MELPEEYQNAAMLANMADYVSGYIVPRAMRINSEGIYYLNEKYAYKDTAGGTVQLKITKVPEGYIVHINEMEKQHKRQRSVKNPFDTDIATCYGKVVAFSIEEYCWEYNVDPEIFETLPPEPQDIQEKIKADIKKLLDTKYTQN